MKHQIVFIHGGNSFKTYRAYLSFLKNWQLDFERYRNAKSDWRGNLRRVLGKRFEVIMPDMPNKQNAKYREWEIWFKKFVPHIKPEIVFIGHSLGGLFLAKFMSENRFPKKIGATFLLAPPYGEGDFVLRTKLKKFSSQGGKIFLYQSKDDKIVPFINFEKYRKLLPAATTRIFSDRGHFFGRSNYRFPEIIKDIRSLYR